jgi:hypothetical protein
MSRRRYDTLSTQAPPQYPPLISSVTSLPKDDDHEKVSVNTQPAGYNVGQVQADTQPPPPGYIVIRFILLSLVLGILAWSIGQLRSWQLATTVLSFAAMLLIGWFFLSLVDSGQFPFSLSAVLNYRLENKRISVVGQAHQRQMERDEYIAGHQSEQQRLLTQLETRLQVAAEHQLMEQVDTHSQPQASRPFFDDLRDELLRFLVSLYDTDDEGHYQHLNPQGRIINITVPWSARGSMSPTESQKALKMLTEAGYAEWIVHKHKNAWYLNLQKYPTPGRLVRAFEHVRTPR